jgi:hypothetical protein
MNYNQVKDADWVRNSFLLPKHAASMRDHANKIHSSAHTKFTDTTLGGNFCINNPAQFAASADLRSGNPLALDSNHMGRIYSEKIDSNSQIIYMRCGVPAFTGLLPFYSGFYDYESATISRTGRSPGFLFTIGKVAGFVVSLPLQPLILAGKMIRFLTGSQTSQFYYMKPTMYSFWTAATTTLNGILVADGIFPKILATKANSPDTLKASSELKSKGEDSRFLSGDIVNAKEDEIAGQGDFAIYNQLLGDIFRADGGVDLYAVANKAHRTAAKARRDMIKIMEDASSSSLDDIRAEAASFIRTSGAYGDPGHQQEMKGGNGTQAGLSAYVAAWQNLPIGAPKEGSTGNESLDFKDEETWTESMLNFFEAELEDGGQFVGFKVNETGSVSESFSNSVGAPDLKGKINGISSSARSKSFDFAAGATGSGFIDGIFSAAKDLVMGVATSLNVDGLAAAFGSAYVDIADRWEDSSANLPTMSYTIELRSPYHNPISRLMNLWVPLSLILTAALPKAAGKAAYDSPFLVELYDKGKAQTRLGIIDSIQIERGVGNLGWTKDKKPLGINITFTVKDLSTVMFMPINGSPGLFDEQSKYSDYMAVLGGMGLSDQIYPMNRVKLNLTRKVAEWKSWTSPAKWGSMLANTSVPGRLMSAFARTTDR